MTVQNSKEYEEAFPFESEYTDWISALESKYTEQPRLVVTNRTKVVLQKDNTEELSPFATVNS